MTTRAAWAAALLLAALAGCAGARDDRVTLRFWGMGREGEVVAELARDFERENPGVRVVVQQIPWSAAHEKLLTAHVGRSTPDVAQLGNTWVSEFSALRALAPLPADVAATRPGYFGGIWDTNVIDGVPYGVPWYVDTRLLFYRKDLLANAGWDRMPETWAEWRRAMEDVKRSVGPDRHAIFLPTNEWAQPAVFGLQQGSPLLADGETRGDFQSPAFRRAFDFYLGLFRDGLAPPINNNQMSNVYQEFERGSFAMYITGPWNVGEFRRRLPAALQGSWTTAPLPGPDSAGVSLAGGSSLVVFENTPHPEEAWKLVEFLSRPEQQVRFYRLTGDLPARVEAWRDSALTSDPQMRAFEQQLMRVVPTPKVPEWELVAAKLLERSEAAIRGALSPAAALASLDRDVERILEKRRWLAEHRRRAKAAVGG